MIAPLPSVPASVIRGRMYARARADRLPLSAEMEIIATCNYKCVHCYIAPCAAREDVMSVESATVIFRKLAAAGTQSILLTGGEIFSHRKFKEIYLGAKRSGFNITLNTNAYFINQRWVDFLTEWPPFRVSISLYGASAETYERVTGIPGSYARCMKAIDLLQRHGIAIDLKCPAMSLTNDDMPAMKAFAESRGVKWRNDDVLSPQEKGEMAPLQLQLSPRQVVDLNKKLDPDLKDLREYASKRVNGSLTDEVYKCGAGRTSLAINVHGGVTTCIASRQVVGNLLEQSFDEVWSALGGKVAVRFPSGHPCATCKFSRMCAGCPATVESLTGLPTGYVQQYCKITHLRAYELGYHPSGVPRTVTDGIPAGVPVPFESARRALPVLTA